MSETKTTEAGERTQHTPGPWIEIEGFIVGHFSDGNVYDICDPRCAPSEFHDEIDANAHLIAAAPELLEGVKDAIAILSGVLKARPDIRNVAQIKAELEAVVSKAEGRS